jgi:hypothetical protein
MILCLSIVTGCKSSASDGCTEGETQSCACPGAETGVQTCLAGGDAWGLCQCSDADSSTDQDVPYDGPCRNDEECDNGLFCDGEETCLEGECLAGTAVTCDDSDDCTTDRCDEVQADCVFEVRDEDGDGFVDEACGGDDCDDADDTNYPGADGDADGFADHRCGGDDCDDSRADVHPDASEDSCFDGLDQACDGVTDLVAQYPTALVHQGTGIAELVSVSWAASRLGFFWTSNDAHRAAFVRADVEGTMVGSATTMEEDGAHGIWTGSAWGIASTLGSEVRFQTRGSDGGAGASTTLWAADVDLDGVRSRVAWSGSEFAVVWCSHASPEGMFFARVDASGEEIGTESSLGSFPAREVREVVRVGGGWVIAHTDMGTDLGLMWVNDDGTPMGSSLSLPGSGITGGTGSMAWSGSTLGVVCAMGASGMNVLVLEADASVLAGPNQVLTESRPASIAWTGSEFMVAAYTTPPESLTAVRVSADGTVGTPATVLALDASVYHPALTWTGSDTVLAWQGYTAASDFNIQLTRLGECD